MLTNIQGQTEGLRYLQRVVEGKLTTPLLLIGTSGTGRRYSVVEAAKEAFGDEDQCYQINRGIHPDFTIVTPEDGKDIKVAAIRDLVSSAGVRPMRAPWKCLVVDGVDRITDAASNALLKTLEEVPSSVRFFLLAENPRKVLPTIRSRCIEVYYRRLPEEFILSKLLEQTEDTTKALVYCRLADGSLGRAVKFYSSGKLILRDRMLGLLKLVIQGDITLLFPAIDTLGGDLDQGLVFLDHLLYDLIMLSCDPSRLTNLDIIEDLRGLQKALKVDQVMTLRSGLQLVQRRRDQTTINLAFHVKSWLASASI